jgi:antitoxin MazE
MRIARWGNSLAIRLPKAVVEALKLTEGDDIEVVVATSRRFEVGKDRRRDAAIERLKKLKWKLPQGFRFSRDQAHER